MTLKNRRKYGNGALNNAGRLDANEQIFFQRELEKRKAKSYDKKYPDLDVRSLFPASFDAGEGAESITYEQYDSVGMAKIVNNYATDFPRTDIKGKEFTARVKSLGASFGYNIQEIRAARMANKPLQQRRANSAKRAILQQEHDIALYGEDSYNIPGFFSNPNIPTATVKDDGTGSSTLWSDKTPDQIIRDMNECGYAPRNNTKNVETANTMLLPLSLYTHIASTPRSSTSDTTILEFFLKNHKDIKQVIPMIELEAANNPLASVNWMVAYRRDPDALTLEIPVNFEHWPLDKKGGDYEVPCHQRIGGVIMYYPMSAVIYDGI